MSTVIKKYFKNVKTLHIVTSDYHILVSLNKSKNPQSLQYDHLIALRPVTRKIPAAQAVREGFQCRRRQLSGCQCSRAGSPGSRPPSVPAAAEQHSGAPRTTEPA